MGTLKEFFTSIYSELIMLTLIFLFFFQTINSFFTGVYALNFAIMGIGPYIILVFFLLSPFLLLIFKRDFPLSGLYITASFLLIARTCMLFISNTVAISIITGVGVAAFFIFYPTYYQWNIKTAKTPLHITMTQAIGLALGLSIGLKTLGSSFDYSTYGYGISIYVVFLLILLLMFPGFHFSSLQKEQKPLETGSFEAVEESPSQQPSFGIFFLISMGLYGIIAILWYALGYPSAFSRWSNAS
ncbi:MAG: hypothetical protein U9O98_02440, partial [Asgard group archaeon]|nr:hypothetical protein [Asgard group archaeon]